MLSQYDRDFSNTADSVRSVSNAKAGAYAPRFNTQRTYYRCLFHSQKAPPSASKGIRARPTRQPLEKPCPFTMSVVANYAPDGQSILTYTINRTSTYDRCPDHTHDLDLVDQTHRPDGLRAIAHHKMWQMAPDAKASVVFQSMKELPRFEDVGGKHFTCGEVYYIGMKFRKPTESMAVAKSTAAATSTSSVNPTPEAVEAQPVQEDVTPPSWLEIKDRKRKRVAEARPPPKPHTPQSRYRPASTTHTSETSQNNPHTTVHRDDLLAHYRQPNQSAQPRQLLDPTQPRQHPDQSTGGHGRYSRDTPPGDTASRVRAILSRPTAGTEHSTPTNTGYTPPPIDLTSSPGGGYDPPPPPPPPQSDNSIQQHTWQPPQQAESSRRQQLLKHHSNTILPNWMTANGPALLPTRSVQHGRSAVMIEAPVSIGDLLRKAAPAPPPKDLPRQDTAAGNGYAKDAGSGVGSVQQPRTVTNERATLSELLSMQPSPAVQREGRERFPANPFS
jgi:hypothetical protein